MESKSNNKKNENLRLYTSRDKIFKQQLEIYNWN